MATARGVRRLVRAREAAWIYTSIAHTRLCGDALLRGLRDTLVGEHGSMSRGARRAPAYDRVPRGTPVRRARCVRPSLGAAEGTRRRGRAPRRHGPASVRAERLVSTRAVFPTCATIRVAKEASRSRLPRIVSLPGVRLWIASAIWKSELTSRVSLLRRPRMPTVPSRRSQSPRLPPSPWHARHAPRAGSCARRRRHASP